MSINCLTSLWARYFLVFFTDSHWDIKKIFHALANLFFFLDVHTQTHTHTHLCFEGWWKQALWLCGVPMLSKMLRGHGRTQTSSGCLRCGWEWQSQAVFTVLPVADNNALSISKIGFHLFFNPLLWGLIYSFIPHWKEVRKYLFKKPEYLPLSNFFIYKKRTPLPLPAAAALLQTWLCPELWRIALASQALLIENEPRFTAMIYHDTVTVVIQFTVCSLSISATFLQHYKGGLESQAEFGNVVPGRTAARHQAPVLPAPQGSQHLAQAVQPLSLSQAGWRRTCQRDGAPLVAAFPWAMENKTLHPVAEQCSPWWTQGFEHQVLVSRHVCCLPSHLPPVVGWPCSYAVWGAEASSKFSSHTS